MRKVKGKFEAKINNSTGIKNKRAIIMRVKCGEKEKSGLLVIDDLGGLEILVFRQMRTFGFALYGKVECSIIITINIFAG